ncbi:hypothetical protein DFJ77DRAFT_448118 [Powellomyces hirtus]|nr:hypothetical protein DFJ77DRAFT_448118 [Powellomyces hirtus]
MRFLFLLLLLLLLLQFRPTRLHLHHQLIPRPPHQTPTAHRRRRRIPTAQHTVRSLRRRQHPPRHPVRQHYRVRRDWTRRNGMRKGGAGHDDGPWCLYVWPPTREHVRAREQDPLQ